MGFSTYLNHFRQKLLNLNLSYLWLSLLVVYPMLFMFQGLDFTDQGYWLTGYQRIFEDPESVTIMMPTWLSLVVGGLVDLIGFGGIAFRIASVMVTWTTIWLSYRLLRECFDREQILFPLFVTLVYITKWGVNWVSYNDLSAMFFLAASLALWFALQRESGKWILLSGLVLGLGVYLRVPNITGIALVGAILFAGWIYGWGAARSLRFVVNFLLGVVSGLLIGLLVMKLLGHLPYFFDSITVLRNQATQQNYHHSSHILLKIFIDDHLRALRYGFLVAVAIIVIASMKKQKFLNKFYLSDFYWIMICLGSIVVTVILALYLEHGLRYRWALPGFCYVVLLMGLIKEGRDGGNKPHALLYFIALILHLTVPLGSGNGIGNAIYGSWLALPLSLLILSQVIKPRNTVHNQSHQPATKVNTVFHQNDEPEFLLTRFKDKPLRLEWLPLAGVSKVIAAVVLLFSGHLAYISTYRDSADRSALRYSVDAPELQGILTSKARSQVVGELLTELQGIVKPGDQLLAVTDIPMLNYLTHTQPYLSSAWTDIIDHERLASELLVAPSRMPLPVVVKAKGSSRDPEWPNVKINPNYSGVDGALIRSFIETNNYHKKWENQWFEIWTIK